MKVVVDIYGGDNAPKEIVKGCVQALKENRGFDLVLVGKANEIADLLKEQTVEMSRVEIVDAPDVITNDDVPTTAIRTKKESSLVVALDRVKNERGVHRNGVGRKHGSRAYRFFSQNRENKGHFQTCACAASAYG